MSEGALAALLFVYAVVLSTGMEPLIHYTRGQDTELGETAEEYQVVRQKAARYLCLLPMWPVTWTLIAVWWLLREAHRMVRVAIRGE